MPCRPPRLPFRIFVFLFSLFLDPFHESTAHGFCELERERPQETDRLFLRHFSARCSDEELREKAVPASEILEALNRGRAVDVSGAIVEGDLDFSQVGLTDPLQGEFHPALVKKLGERGEQQNRVIRVPFSLTGSRVRGRVLTDKRVIFMKKVIFSQAAFLKHLTLSGVVFLEGAKFLSTIFSGDADFSDSYFGGETLFSMARFEGRLDFSGSIFEQYMEVAEARVSESARFSHVLFLGDAYFRRSIFEKEAIFAGSTFTREADFSKVFFSLPPDFAGVTFAEDPTSHGFRGIPFLISAGLGLAAFFGVVLLLIWRSRG